MGTSGIVVVLLTYRLLLPKTWLESSVGRWSLNSIALSQLEVRGTMWYLSMSQVSSFLIFYLPIQIFFEIFQICRSSRPEVFCKRCSAGLRPTTLLKKRLWHRCFPVNFVKFRRAPFFIEHLWWRLLNLRSKVMSNTNLVFDTWLSQLAENMLAQTLRLGLSIK